MWEADAVWPRRLRRLVRASLIHWRRPDLVETAELLLTELATNALRHAHGPDIGVRVQLQDDHLVIEVRDGSPLVPVPRCAGPDDENGRGLLLVEALADAWGVSADGTTTWCTVSLADGLCESEPVAATAPVLREVQFDLPPDSSASTIARISGRTRLTVLNWPGNVQAATDVLGCLVDNAAKHGSAAGGDGQRLSVRLSVTEAQELLIDVTDSDPACPDFADAVDGAVGRGLWNARQLGARLCWFIASDSAGKTVRAAMSAGRVAL